MRPVQRIVAAALVAAFLLALVAFGGRSMAWVIAGCAVVAAGAAVALGMLRGGSNRVPRLSLVAACALLVLPLLSVLPLPRSLAALMGAGSPRRAAIASAMPHGADGFDRILAAGKGRSMGVDEALRDEQTSTPRTLESNGDAASRPLAPLSFDRQATLIAVAVLACFLGLLVALTRTSERLGLVVLGACGAATAVMGVYAIAWSHLGNGKIYGIFAAPPNVGQQPFGPFWNPNHFAALLAAFGIVALATLLSREVPAWVRVAAAVAALPFWLGVADAGSRGGVLGAVAGLLIFGILLVTGPAPRRVLGVGLLGLAMLGLLLATLVMPERILEQSLDTATEMSGSNFERTRIYRAELAMVKDAPLAGVGLGAFRMAYPAFQTVPDQLVPLHGESDWLESLAEGGVPLASAWLLLLASLLWPALRGARRADAPILLSGLIAATAALLAHAAVDFHLREPSVALVAVILAGTAAAWGLRLSASSAEGSSKVAPSDRPGRFVALSAGCLGILILAALAGRFIPWDRAMRQAELAYASGMPERALAAATTATKAWPARGSAWALVAASEEQLAKASKPRERAAHRERALIAAIEALRRNPMSLGAARCAGQVLLAGGADAEALELAHLAVIVAPGHASAHRLLGQALLRADRSTEALPHLAFAFDAMPFEQVSQQGVALARMLRDAGGGDATIIFGHMKDREARVRYIHRLLADAHEDEIGDCLAVVMDEGVPPGEADSWAYALVGGSAEAAEFGRRLLPNVTEPISRVRIAKALLAVPTTRASGRELLARVIAEPGAPADGFASLAQDLAAQGEAEAARATLQAGLAAHPGDATLLALSR